MSDVFRVSRVIVGNDGSDAARRRLMHARRLGVEAMTKLVLAVTSDLRSAGSGAAPAGDAAVRRLPDEARELLGCWHEDGGGLVLLPGKTISAAGLPRPSSRSDREGRECSRG